MPISLSERQAKTVGVAITIVAVLVILFALAAFFWLLGWFFRYFSNVFLPIAVGGIAALVFRPYYQWLCERLKLPRPLALVAVFVSMLLPLTAFLWFFGSLMARQIVELVSHAPEWWKSLASLVEKQWPQVREFLATPRGQQVQEAVMAQQDYLLHLPQDSPSGNAQLP